jgi:hypothetical protein
MARESLAEGWFEDPFGIHAHRWFSAGNPSPLVRDGSVETNDPPPNRPIEGPLTPAATSRASDGADMRRADEAESEDPYASSDAAMGAWGKIFPQP